MQILYGFNTGLRDILTLISANHIVFLHILVYTALKNLRKYKGFQWPSKRSGYFQQRLVGTMKSLLRIDKKLKSYKTIADFQ